MITIKRIALALLSFLGISSPAYADSQQRTEPEAMQSLRLMALSSSSKYFGLQPSEEFPRTYGVLIDFPIAQETATIVAFSDGTSSLYTTSTFGIIGGGAHEKVSFAAKHLVSSADQFFDEAAPTKEYSLPRPGKVRFYFVSFNGVRVIETDITTIESNRSKYSSIFWLGQSVLTELRLATEKK